MNDDKTEIVIVLGNRRGDDVDYFGSLNLGELQLNTVESIKNLRVYFDSKRSFKMLILVCS